MYTFSKNLKRLTAFLLCALLMLGALPLQPASPQASAAHWASAHVDKLQSWGVMKGYADGSMGEDRPLTRAEMAAMLNRAFGFTRTGPIPFTDVRPGDWFYADIATAYTEGILNGTSPTKASPYQPVTREQALVLIARSLRFDQSAGEVTEFTDGREFNPWSTPYVRSAVLSGIICGLADGSFKPGRSVTRGEVAKMLSIGVGNLIHTQGEHSLGGVFGNVTINTQKVTLRDTVIAGDLYLTGGVALGDVILDNVRVLGRIVVAGGGESETGEASIILNNVEAQKLQIDPATGQYVSLRSFGATNIPETIVRSSAYIQDDVRDNTKGLRNVSLEAQDGAVFTIAGNMKDVVNRTPGSTLTVGDTGVGSVTSITVDEKAPGSHLVLDINAEVDRINLDTATDITGSGDIGHLYVSTNGSSCDILPDKVEVRPGVITQIKDMTNVDSEIAKEISSDPRLLQGYPKAKNIAPTTADGYFSVNKAGTIYWALTNAAIGPLGDADAENLISPSEYGSGLLQFGNINAEASNTEYDVRVTGMEPGGTYYLSALLVDAHGRRSPVKAQKILTPDGSVPAMTAGFPTFADRTPTRNSQNADMDFSEIVDVQATVMASKSCDLYYVLLAKGSTQPQTSEFLSGSFVDPYGFGRIHLIKNTMDSFKVNEIDLNLDDAVDRLGEVEENSEYDLYLWLTDADGSQSSQITKHTVRTKDITPPQFNLDEMVQTATQATSVRLTNSLNEAGTVYWVAVDNGAEYPVPKDGMSSTDPAFLSSDYAKLQVINGLNGFKNGKVSAKANVDFNITVSGLTKESAYDIYYVAVDTAGNYSDPVRKFSAHTLDQTPPTATQEFESCPEDSPTTPYADSTIDIVFSEDIRYKQPSGSSLPPYEDPVLLNLYNNYVQAKKTDPSSEETRIAENLFTSALRDMIVLYDYTSHKPVAERVSSDSSADWTVDYRNVQVFKEGAKLVVSFRNSADHTISALNLQSGASYYFQLKNIADESELHNPMSPTTLPTFTTVSAQVIIGNFEGGLTLKAYETTGGVIDTSKPIESNGDDDEPTDQIPIDIAFTAEPRSTSTTADGIYWDMLFWFDTSVEFELFTRVKGAVDDPWTQVGGPGKTVSISVPDNATSLRGASVIRYLGGTEFHYINEPYKAGGTGCGLNDAEDQVFEYALHFVRIGNNTTRSTFSELVNGQVTYVTGSASTLGNLANSLTTASAFDNVINNKNNVTEITMPKDLERPERQLTKQFSDGKAPQLANDTPRFEPTDNGVTATLQLDRPGTVFYVLSPVDKTTGAAVSAPSDANHSSISMDILEKYIATSGAGVTTTDGQPDSDYDSTDAGKPNGKTMTTDPGETVERYKFVYPNSLNIMNPRGTGLNSPYLKTGSQDIGIADEPLQIDGLAPETTYYFYIVTQGASGVLSEVKVYQFTTKPITRPIITLRTSGSNVTISSNIEAVVDYMIVPYSDTAMDKVIKEEIELKVPDGSGLPEPTSGPMKVYEAMGKNVTSGTESAGSWFDCYDLKDGATITKDDIADYIRTSTPNSSSILGVGTVTVSAKGSVVIQCAKDWELTPGVNYAFLVVGRSPVGSGDAFRATYPFQVTDDEAPVIDSVNNTLHATYDTTDKRWYVEGDLVLTFNEPLWYLKEGINGQQTLSKITNAKEPDPTIFVCSSNIVETISPGVSIVTTAKVDKPQQATSFTIRFSDPALNEKSPSGSSAIFFPGISDAGYNARMDNPLSVSVRVTGAPDDTPTITVVIPDAWKKPGLIIP